MMSLFLLLILAATAAGIWFQGFWNAAVTLVNLILAMMIATNLFEPIGYYLSDKVAILKIFGQTVWTSGPLATYTYLMDFISLWIVFAVAFGILRAVTDAISKKAVEFDLPVEIAGRSILALVCGWVMVCFVAFSLQMAPLNQENPLGAWATPKAKTFGPFSPDRMWLGFVYSRSRQALAGNKFDEGGDFLVKYHDRRAKYAAPGTSMRFQ